MKYRNKWKTWLVYGLIVLPWCCYCSIMRCRMASTWRCSNRCLSFYVCLSVCLSVYVSGFDNKMRRQTGLSFDNQSLSMIGTYCRLDWLICWGQILSLIYHWNDDAFVMAIMTASISFSEFPASFYPPPRQTRLIAGGVLLSTQPVCPSVHPFVRLLPHFWKRTNHFWWHKWSTRQGHKTWLAYVQHGWRKRRLIISNKYW